MRQALPVELIDETIQTLALLLPRAKGESKYWFQKVRRRYPEAVDARAADLEPIPGGRAQHRYPYWHDRLSIIQKAYDESEPKDLFQWWHDRRKKVQWYTFWVALVILILTVVFGLIQSITQVMQVYAAFHSMQNESVPFASRHDL